MATAAGMCAIAHATDGAGSIRYPAAYCGLFGLKPQRNRISLSPDREHWYGLSVSGCVSRTVMDTALYLDAMSGPESGDFESPPPFERPLIEAASSPPGKLRIGCTTKTATPVKKAPEVLAAYAETIELLRSLGHEVTEAAPRYGRARTDFFPLYFRGHPRRGAQPAPPGTALGAEQGLHPDGSPVQRSPDEQGQGPHAGGRRQDPGASFATTTCCSPRRRRNRPFEVGKLLGKGAVSTMNEMAKSTRTGSPGTTRASRRRRFPPVSPIRACRAR